MRGGEPTGGRRQREFKAQRNRIGKLEREIDKLTETREQLLERLGEESIYRDENRDQLQAALVAQAENQQRLESAEEEWLRLSETLESAQE